MKKTYTCDKCGKNEKLYLTKTEVGGKKEHAQYRIDASDLKHEQGLYQLCKKCYHEVLDFINNQ